MAEPTPDSPGPGEYKYAEPKNDKQAAQWADLDRVYEKLTGEDRDIFLKSQPRDRRSWLEGQDHERALGMDSPKLQENPLGVEAMRFARLPEDQREAFLENFDDEQREYLNRSLPGAERQAFEEDFLSRPDKRRAEAIHESRARQMEEMAREMKAADESEVADIRRRIADAEKRGMEFSAWEKDEIERQSLNLTEKDVDRAAAELAHQQAAYEAETAERRAEQDAQWRAEQERLERDRNRSWLNRTAHQARQRTEQAAQDAVDYLDKPMREHRDRGRRWRQSVMARTRPGRLNRAMMEVTVDVLDAVRLTSIGLAKLGMAAARRLRREPASSTA